MVSLRAAAWVLLWTIATAVAWSWIVGSLLPETVIPYDDDVGYLRSVVLTLEHGRPWTDDWLEPWAASLSALSALVYRVTGSFTTATHGVLIFLAASGVIGVATLSVRRGLPPPAAALSSIVLLSFPTILWKQTQFTSVALYLPCMTAALIAAEKRRWHWFLAVFVVAVAARQSAVAWLALPAWELFREWRSTVDHSPRRYLAPAAALIGGLGAYVAIAGAMNETYAQRVMTSAMWANLDGARCGRAMLLSAAVFGVAVGCGGLLRDLLHSNGRCLRGRAMRTGLVIAGTLAACVGSIAWFHVPIELELPLREAVSHGRYLWMAAGLGLAGWAWRRWELRADYGVTAGAAAALVGLRGEVWDYYLLDLAVLGFFAAEPSPAVSCAVAGPWVHRVRSCMGVIVVVFALQQHRITALAVKRVMDGSRALTVLVELALRGKRIHPAEISIAPFGFQVWHLYPHFTRTLGRGGRYIADFSTYLRPGALALHVEGADSDALESTELGAEDGSVAVGVFRAMWNERYTFSLRRQAKAQAAAELIGEDYVFEPYPITDAEWRELIERDCSTSLVGHEPARAEP